jgi:hypothetical protein
MRLIPLALFVAACGGASAESPLNVQLGLTHDQTAKMLKDHQFCLEVSSSAVMATQQKQTFPRCERAASELGDAWVIAVYEGDKLVELRRFERYPDDAKAMERWNKMVEDRMKMGPPDDAALQQIKDKGQLEPGTRSVKAFRGEPGTVVGVYLLTPFPPDNANVLEKVTYLK